MGSRTGEVFGNQVRQQSSEIAVKRPQPDFLRCSVIVLAEQSELRRVAGGGLGEPQVTECMRGQEPPARRTLDEALLDQERLDDLLDGVARLRQRRRDGLDPDRTAGVVLRDQREIAPVHGVETSSVDLERAQRTVSGRAVDRGCAADKRKVAHAPQQPSRDARRAAGAARDLVGAVGVDADAEQTGAAVDNLFELRLRIEVEPDRDAEAVAQRVGEKAGAGGGADQREPRQIDLDRARRRALADDQVELKILHRRIEDFLDRRIEPVDLVDEQHVARLEIGEQRREIAGLGDHRSRGGAKIRAELARHDLGKRGLAEPWGADEQHMVERLAAGAGGLDEYAEIGARLALADELVEPLRAQRGFRRIVVAALGRDKAGGAAHLASSLRPRRINCDTSASWPTLRAAAAIAAAACGWP